MSSYDLIIVGAGISGLRVGIEVLKKNPNLRCCILEKYNYIGGRVVTFRKHIPKIGEVQWENGAGRISIHHKRVMKLLETYKLTFLPIGDDIDFIKDSSDPFMTGNKFTTLINFYLGPLLQLPKETLATHTIKELLDKTVGPSAAKDFYEEFPYYSEIHDLRADLALESFKGEMGTYNGFGVCAEGLSSLIDGMMNEFIFRGGTILTGTEVYRLTNKPDNSISISCRIVDSDKRVIHTGRSVVLALHSEAIKHIEGVSTLPVLNHLKMTPLLRIYAVFPSKRGVSWFSGLNKIVTNSFIRYIIPVDTSRGIIMISYTDGADAKWWMKQEKKGGDNNVRDLIMSEIRGLFPDRTIPDPVFFKQHPWFSGCTYWLPGNYSVIAESEKSCHPLPVIMPRLFMCGESFAVHQCWMESALDQADRLLGNAEFIRSLRV